MTTPTPSRPEAQARRLLAAYPWRMRAEQGDEIVATVLDTLPPGAGRLPWRTAVDLVRGGLRTRRQRRPPFHTRLAFWCGRTIHPRWIWWVFDALEDPGYRRKATLRRMAMGVVAYLPVLVLYRHPGNAVVGATVWAVMSIIGWGIWGERERRYLRTRHGLVPGGSDPNVVWVTTTRSSPRPVAWWMVEGIRGAEVWTPESEEARTEERPPDPAT